MFVFIVRRLIGLIVVLFAITVLTFVIFFAVPGIDPTRSLAGRNPTPETVAAVRHEFGLDRSKPVQYALMMKRIFITRDLVSYGNQALNVVPAIFAATPVTLSLVFGAAIIWVVMSILLGLLAVVLKGTIFDPLLMILALIGISMPVFWLGEMANLITQDRLHDTFLFSWVPPLGYVPLTQNPWQWFLHLVIPWLTLSVLYIGFYARVLRANLLDVENEDYVRTARAKGLSESRVVYKHVLKNGLIPVVTVLGLQLGVLLAGAIITEKIFGWPGLGLLLVEDGIGKRDYRIVQGCVLAISTTYIIANTLTDMLYRWLDPRIRVS